MKTEEFVKRFVQISKENAGLILKTLDITTDDEKSYGEKAGSIRSQLRQQNIWKKEIMNLLREAKKDDSNVALKLSAESMLRRIISSIKTTKFFKTQVESEK